MRKTYPLLFITIYLIFSLSIYSQHVNKETINFLDYYPKKNKALALFKEKKYDEVYFLLKEVYDEYGTNIAIEDGLYVTYVRAADLSNQCFSRFKAVKFLIEKCGYGEAPLKYKEHDLHQIYIKSGIDKEYIKILRRRYLKSINMLLRKRIIKIIKRDQLYRKGYRGVDRRIKIDSVDAINEKLLINIFEKNEYPSVKLIGNYWIDNKHTQLSAVLKHTNDSVKLNYFLPKMLEFVKKGTCSPEMYKSVYDYYVIKNNLQNKLNYQKNNNKSEVDKNRYDCGLPLLKKKEK